MQKSNLRTKKSERDCRNSGLSILDRRLQIDCDLKSAICLYFLILTSDFSTTSTA
jgi:hypothetical protein